MPAPKFTSALAKEYSDLFNTCEIRLGSCERGRKYRPANRCFPGPVRIGRRHFDGAVYVIAVIHNMECGLDFTEHLHNRDPFTSRTINGPPGRPKTGRPRFAWEVSALARCIAKRWTNDL